MTMMTMMVAAGNIYTGRVLHSGEEMFDEEDGAELFHLLRC